jgi:hypothetical protein
VNFFVKLLWTSLSREAFFFLKPFSFFCCVSWRFLSSPRGVCLKKLVLPKIVFKCSDFAKTLLETNERHKLYVHVITFFKFSLSFPRLLQLTGFLPVSRFCFGPCRSNFFFLCLLWISFSFIF